MKVAYLAAATLAAVALSGCASIIRGTSQDVAFETSPPGATATLSTGQNCVTPCTLKLPRKTAFDVTLMLPGYQPATQHVTSGWSRGGTQTFIIGNIILGGVIGMGVDAANGAARDLTPNPVSLTLTPVPAPSAAPVAAAPAPAAEAPVTAPPPQ